jgi:Fe-S oxidoreductase
MAEKNTDDDELEKKENLKSIENLIKKGKVRATCPICSNMLESVYKKKCDICNQKVIIDEIKLSYIDWSKAN